MRKTVGSWALVCAFALVAGAGGCGGDGSGGGGEDQQAPPLTLEKSMLGVGLHHGELGNLGAGGSASQEVLARTTSTFRHAFLHLQIYDEHAREFGEWEWMPGATNDYRQPAHFIRQPDRAKLTPRADDLFNEVQSVAGNGFATRGVVVDFWRSRNDWYVRWDGNLDSRENRRGEGPYGFYRSDMVESSVNQIRAVVTEHEPEYLIVGTDMERLLGTEDGEGLAPDDFSNFKRFYRKVVSEVKKVSPSTKVGAGINWDRFARHVAPIYGPGERGTAPDEATLAAAFEAVIQPLVKVGDIVALKSYRSDGEAPYYRILADLEERFGITKPVVWYSIGSPATATNLGKQQLYLESFKKWNAGVDPEVVAWRSLTHIDGADASNQSVQGRCKQMIETKDLSMPREHCFDGLFTTLLEAKDVFKDLEDAASE